MKSYDEADKCLTRLVTEAIKDGWSRPALTDYQGDSMTYGNIAEKIETFHIAFARLGIERGDAVALCGRNCANWAVAFMATVTYGAVAVPILHEFKTEQIGNILEHSESKLLFAADNILKELEQVAGRPAMPPHLLAVVNLADFNFSLLQPLSSRLIISKEQKEKRRNEKETPILTRLLREKEAPASV